MLLYLLTKTIILNHFKKDTAAFILGPAFSGPFTCSILHQYVVSMRSTFAEQKTNRKILSSP